MNKKIKMATMVVCVGAMLCIVGCGDAGGGSASAKLDTPDAVIVNVLTTVQSGKANAEFLKATCTDETAAFWSSCIGELQEDIKGATFTVVDKKIEGDKASVFIKQVGGKHPKDKEEFLLMKVGGKWKVMAN